jgi:multidrug efflux pump subunit AcrB
VINTIYQGASPEDIDDLITTKIEKEIKDVE